MQETIFIFLIVLIVFYFLNQRKKRKEQQMGEKLDDLIEANEWQGVSRILRKQLVIWGLLAVIATATAIASFILGKPRYGIILVAALFIWRAVKLVRNYRTSRYNERYQQVEVAEGQPTVEDLQERLTSLKREKISMKFAPLSDEALPIGSSKYGGQPDVPDGFEWPFDNEGHPLSLMLQINCADIANMDNGDLLPKSGMLYFFYQVSEQPWDNTTNGARVLYFDAPITELHRQDYPDSLADEEIITERTLQFKKDVSYPSWDDFLNLCPVPNPIDIWDNYDIAYENLNEDSQNEEIGIGFMLGYAELIQNAVVDNLEENVLLLQLDSDEENDDGVMFGDCGRIYYYIAKQDLIDRRFDRLTFELQCY